MDKIMGMMGSRPTGPTITDTETPCSAGGSVGAEDGIRTRALTLAKKGYDIGWFASFGSAEQGLHPVGFSADSAESARFLERWFNALNEADFAEMPRAVPSQRPKQNRPTTPREPLGILHHAGHVGKLSTNASVPGL